MKTHKTVAEFLRCAKGLIKRGWTQGRYAKSKAGRGVDVMSKSAAKFCMIGAMLRCDGDSLTPSRLYMKASDTLNSVVPGGRVAVFNDTAKSKAEVLAKYDEAIRLARQEH